jgi:DNA repair exonuclease SbcCD ATPase subunit
MKQVDFKKITIENFLSIGNVPVTIDFQRGINIITGINLDKEGSKNGVGKSTILDAIHFVLFGETIRELKKEHIVNRHTRKNCKVVLEFEVNGELYILTRTIEPTAVELLQPSLKEKKDITKSSMPKTTAYVQSLINCTPEVFQQSILMSINSTSPFMTQRKVEKRKFIEGILKLGVFSEMLNAARLDYNETKKETDLEKNALNDLVASLEKYYFQQTNFDSLKATKIKELNERIVENKSDIEKLKKLIKVIDKEDRSKKITEIVEEEATYKKTVNDLTTDVIKVNSSIKSLEKEFTDLEKKGLSCDKCHRPFTEQDIEAVEARKEEINSHLVTKRTELILLESTLTKQKKLVLDCDSKKDKIREEIYQIELDKKENENIENKIQNLNVIIKQNEKDIDNEEQRTSGFKTLIDESEARKGTLDNRVLQLCKKTDILEAVKFVVSEEGVKSFIVKKILTLLNNRLAIYLNKLEANCRCSFNEYFEEVILDDKGHDCCYYNFSGGERKRIDLAMLFTFQDIRRLQGDVTVNLNMYDELLDSSLDGKGIECVLNTLYERVENYGEAIYIITHNPLTMNVAINSTINLVKSNGITKLST